MKRLLCIVFSVVFCFVLSSGALAVVEDGFVADIVDGIADLIEAESEGDSEAFSKAVDGLYADIQPVREGSNVAEIVSLAIKYISNEESDISDVFSDRGAVEAVLSKFFVDEGYDVEKIKAELKQSTALDTLVNLYTGANPETPKTQPVSDAQEIPDMPAIENPNTGEGSSGVMAALIILVTSASVAIATSKKE